jgi:hypothetical protein
MTLTISALLTEPMTAGPGTVVSGEVSTVTATDSIDEVITKVAISVEDSLERVLKAEV